MLDLEEELYLRISAHLDRAIRAATKNRRVSVDAAVNMAKRDAFIRDLNLTDLQVREHVVFQATREGYIVFRATLDGTVVDMGPDTRNDALDAPATKVWITAPEKWR